MDVHLQTNPQLHFRVNGGANSRSSAEDEALRFLSQEEQECIQFFEETIDSLEESLDQEERSGPEPVETSSSTSGSVPGSSSASSPGGPSAGPPMADHRGPKDQDIIDLLQPDLVQTKEPVFDPIMPDFQNMVRTPDSHVEVRSSKRDLMDTLPSEYNPPLPGSSYGPGGYNPPLPSSSYGPGGDHPPGYHPPGSIPTPVLIAQKIAQNQNLRRRSLDSDKPALISHAASSSKQGPPTSTKPSRFPANIKLESHPHHNNNQSLASVVSIHERRAQMLANLTGTCHPLDESSSAPPPEKDRNLPTRSVSFRDPTPDKSRMEALSKLGLTRNRARSGGSSTPVVTPPAPDTTDTTDTGSSAVRATPPTSQTLVAETRAETAVLPDPIGGPKTIRANPSPPSTVTLQSTDKTVTPQSTYQTVTPQSTYQTVTPQSTEWPPPPPESEPTVAPQSTYQTVAPQSTYQTVAPQSTYQTVTPQSTYQTVTTQSSDWPPPPPPPPPESEPAVTPTPPEVSSLDFNTYGGKSMVVSPSAASNDNKGEPWVTEGGHHDGKAAHPPSLVAVTSTSDYNSYGGKSRVMSPASPTSVITASRGDLPDILSSHIHKSRAAASPGRPETLPYEVNSYGGKTRSIAPSSSSRGSNPPALRGGPAPARTPSNKAPQAPSPAPKPIRQPHHHHHHHHHHGPSLSSTAPPQRAASPPEPARRRSVSKPSPEEPVRRASVSKPGAAFRSQGITVQFSGRGATDESRREALRRLGLLKDTC